MKPRSNESQAADEPDDRRVFDVVNDVIAAVAPEELSLLSSMRNFDDVEAGRRLVHRRLWDDPLGFGMTENVVLVTPIAWAVVAEQVSRPTARISIGRLRSLIRQKCGADEPTPVATYEHDMPAVRDRAVALARHAGMPEARMEQLAEQLVYRLDPHNRRRG